MTSFNSKIMSQEEIFHDIDFLTDFSVDIDILVKLFHNPTEIENIARLKLMAHKLLVLLMDVDVSPPIEVRKEILKLKTITHKVKKMIYA